MSSSALGTSPAGASTAPGDFFPLSPRRVLDTRHGAPLGPGESRPVLLAGVGGLPAAGEARAVALNVTATDPTAETFLAVYPSGVAPPVVSNVNALAGETVANAVVTGVGADGHVVLHNAAGTTDVLVDVVGWFSATPRPGGSKFLPVTPARLADTRPDRPVFGYEPLLMSLSDAPPYDQVRGAVLNVTATQPQGHGYFSVTPWDGTGLDTSVLNFTPGQTVAGAAFATLGANRQVGVFNGGPLPVHQVIDLGGVFVGAAAARGGTFTPVTPVRLYDSRQGPGPLGAGEARTLPLAGSGVPPEAAAVVANVTVTGASQETFLTVWPAGAHRPGVSHVNAGPADTVANLVTTSVAGGAVQLFNAAGRAHVVVDVLGWYAPTSAAAAAA